VCSALVFLSNAYYFLMELMNPKMVYGRFRLSLRFIEIVTDVISAVAIGALMGFSMQFFCANPLTTHCAAFQSSYVFGWIGLIFIVIGAVSNMFLREPLNTPVGVQGSGDIFKAAAVTPHRLGSDKNLSSKSSI
jgi:hypothetical protein